MRNRLDGDLDRVLKDTEGLWEELRGQRIFLTGGMALPGTVNGQESAVKSQRG